MKLFNRLRQELRNILYEVYSRFAPVNERVMLDVPYVCQFAVPESAELTLGGKLNSVEDPDWRESGAASPEQYEKWALTMCGMASTAMALEYFNGNKYKPAVLAEDALKHGVYATESNNTLSGMKYREFAKWIKDYGLTARVYSRLSVNGIKYALSSGKLVIVSVNPNIRGNETAPVAQRGGHLVLVVGYDSSEDTITINNPSGYTSSNTQIQHKLPLSSFKKYYAGRGIVLSSHISR